MAAHVLRNPGRSPQTPGTPPGRPVYCTEPGIGEPEQRVLTDRSFIPAKQAQQVAELFPGGVTAALPEQEPAQELLRRTQQLEEQVERLKESLASICWRVIDGYAVSVVQDPDEGVGFIAACPTLHCVASADTLEEAVAEVRGQMEDVRSMFEDEGRRIPEPDVS